MVKARSNVFNFSPGPATLPRSVLEKAQAACVDWEGRGVSVMEISHRSDAFQAIVNQTIDQIRRLLAVPKGYHVLWMAGGARWQYAAVPLNLSGGRPVGYVDTGHWSRLAMQEAARVGVEVHQVASAAEGYQTIPDTDAWSLSSDLACVHVVDNETVHGVEYPTCPETHGVPLVSDMTSNILSRPIDVNRYALLYASTQKNLGPAGLTLVVVHPDYLRGAMPNTPTALRYATYCPDGKLYNTPPTWVWYVVSLVLDWLEAEGGAAAMADRNAAKAARLYAYLDQSAYYTVRAQPGFRSRMNVVFNLPNPDDRPAFLQAAEQRGLLGLKGHAALGGLRASLYNAMPMAGVEALIAFLDDFKHA